MPYAYCQAPGCTEGSAETLTFAERLKGFWRCSHRHRNDIGYHGETKVEALIELEERVRKIEGFLNLDTE